MKTISKEVKDELMEALNSILFDSDISGEEFVRVLKEFVKVLKLFPTSEPENRWISVEDRLPEDSKTVLVTGTHGKVQFHHVSKLAQGYWRISANVTNDEQRIGRKVTHWQPLPLPPVT